MSREGRKYRSYERNSHAVHGLQTQEEERKTLNSFLSGGHTDEVVRNDCRKEGLESRTDILRGWEETMKETTEQSEIIISRFLR